jgi:hypothetical protein
MSGALHEPEVVRGRQRRLVVDDLAADHRDLLSGQRLDELPAGDRVLAADLGDDPRRRQLLGDGDRLGGIVGGVLDDHLHGMAVDPGRRVDPLPPRLGDVGGRLKVDPSTGPVFALTKPILTVDFVSFGPVVCVALLPTDWLG